jgi:hypothetical protein
MWEHDIAKKINPLSDFPNSDFLRVQFQSAFTPEPLRDADSKRVLALALPRISGPENQRLPNMPLLSVPL